MGKTTINSGPEFFIGQDDGTNIGPFKSLLEASEWGVNNLTRDEVLSPYQDEAIELKAGLSNARYYNTLGDGESFIVKAIDLFDSVDWILFAVECWGSAKGGDAVGGILDPDTVRAPQPLN